MSDRPAKRLLIIGWDAADWKLIDPLLASGAMPNLKRLIERGVRSDLASLDPKLSPILWTSIATGKTADKHGILNFIEADPNSGSGGGVRISSSLSRKTKAIWNILSQSDRRSIVVNWYASHPAEPIRGVMVSNLFQDGPPKSVKDKWEIAAAAVSPASESTRVSGGRVHPSAAALHDLRVLLPRSDALPHDDRRIALMRKLIAQCRSVHNVALALLSSGQPWQCAMVFYDLIDVAGHHFMQYHPPRMEHVSKRDFAALSGVMNGVYRLHDRMLGDLLKAAGDDATVIVLSDHGFHSDHLRPKTATAIHDEHAAMDATWHRQTGMLAMAGLGVRSGAAIRSPSLLDITPTALTLLGLPVGEDMDGRVLAEALQGSDGDATVVRVPSWDAIEGESGLHPPDMRSDPFESQEALKQLADLGYIEPLSDNIEQTLRNVDRESRFNLGVVYMSTRRFKHAVESFKHLVEAFPDETRFITNLAHCQSMLGDTSGAVRTLGLFVERHPDAAEARSLQASLLLAQGREDEAAALLEELARAVPNEPERWIALAGALRLAERFDEASAAVRRALALDPSNANAHHEIALQELAQRRFEAAAEAALNAVEHQHGLFSAHHTLGVALAWMGETDDAAKCFAIALSLQPGLIESRSFLAAICRLKGRTDEAANHEEEVRRLMRAGEADSHAGEAFGGESPLGPGEWARAMGRVGGEGAA